MSLNISLYEDPLEVYHQNQQREIIHRRASQAEGTYRAERLVVVPTLHIHLLGEFLLTSNDGPVTSVDLPRLQSLLAYLTMHHAAAQPRSHLAYLLWPESTESQAHTNLRNLVHRLRQALPHADAFLRVERQELQWQPERSGALWTLDVLDFEQTVAQAEQAKNLAAKRQALEQAVKLYRGDLLPSCYEEWILPERDRLRQVFLRVLNQLSEALEQGRDYQAAIDVDQHLLRYDPLNEATYRHLMHMYAVSGDRVAALRTYHTCATVLERELGVEPSRFTREMYERLVQMKEPTRPLVSSQPMLVAEAPLVGRESEWTQLQAAWRSALAGRPHMVVLKGEAGIGKTRLAEELLTWVERQGMVTATARCYAAQGGLVYAPVVGWLRVGALRTAFSKLADVWLIELARLLPDLLLMRPDLPSPSALTENWEKTGRQHLFEALARAVLGNRRPLVLLLDDMQWCDHETLAWLHYLLRFDQQAPLLIIGTLREELAAEQAVMALLGSLQREGQLVEIALGPLDAADTASLAAHVAGRKFDTTLATALYEETEGNPLFVVETVRATTWELDGRDDEVGYQQETSLRTSSVPSTVRAVIASRLAQLSPQAREVMSVASVIGRAFSLDVLARASGRDEDALVLGLDELWKRRIVREQGSDAYDFSHGKLREEAYSSLSKARRRLLHRRVAEALADIHADDANAVSGQIAVHYEQAGLLQQAIVYYQKAGEASRQIYASVEAIAFFQRALALLNGPYQNATQQEWQREMTMRLYECLGDVLDLIGQYDESRNGYQQASEQILMQDRIGQARLRRKIAKTWERQRCYEEALSAYERAESALGEEPTEDTKGERAAGPYRNEHVEWWQEWIEIQNGKIAVHYWLDQVHEMTKLIKKTWLFVEQYGTPASRAAFFLSLANTHLRRDRYVVSEETLRYARIALSAYEGQGDLIKIGQARYTLGFCHLWQGNLDAAEEHMHAALAMAERTGDVTLQSHCLTYLSMVKRKRGQVEETRDSSLQALTLATMAQRPEYVGAAKAHLAWVAWRQGKLSEAQVQGCVALEIWQQKPLVYPFLWSALWPLIGVMLAQERLAEAVDYAQALLEPEQQRLPDTLMTIVESAVRAWNSDQRDVARSNLQQAASIAHEMGYF